MTARTRLFPSSNNPAKAPVGPRGSQPCKSERASRSFLSGVATSGGASRATGCVCFGRDDRGRFGGGACGGSEALRFASTAASIAAKIASTDYFCWAGGGVVSFPLSTLPEIEPRISVSA